MDGLIADAVKAITCAFVVSQLCNVFGIKSVLFIEDAKYFAYPFRVNV